MSCLRSTTSACGRVAAARGSARAGDDVRRGDDEVRRARPSRSPRRRARRRGGDAHDARARVATRGGASTRGSGGGVGGAGPAIDGNGSTRANARSTVRGGTIRFSCCRIVDCRAPRRAASAGPGAAGARRRRPRRARGRAARRRASPPIESSSRSGGITAQAPARERAGERCDRLERAARRRPPRRAPASGVYGEFDAAVQEVRREPRADHRTERRGRRARARSRRARAGARRAPTAPRSASAIQSTRAISRRVIVASGRPGARAARPAGRYTGARTGGVVQLVRTPACHAGGRGFESRRSRRREPRRSRGFVFSTDDEPGQRPAQHPHVRHSLIRRTRVPRDLDASSRRTRVRSTGCSS